VAAEIKKEKQSDDGVTMVLNDDKMPEGSFLHDMIV